LYKASGIRDNADIYYTSTLAEYYNQNLLVDFPIKIIFNMYNYDFEFVMINCSYKERERERVTITFLNEIIA